MRSVVSLLGALACVLAAAGPAPAETRPDLVLGAGDTLSVTFDQPYGIVTCPPVPVVVSSGPVSLGGAALSVAASYPPGAGYGCVLIDNRGSSPVAGTFAGLPEGTVFGPANARFKITYSGGDGNDVALKRVEVPTKITGGAIELYASDQPVGMSVTVIGDTPTALAATGTITATVDGVDRGTYPLQHSSATIDLGVLTVGDHQLQLAYSGGSYGGDLVYLPTSLAGTIAVKPARIPSLPGGGGQAVPTPPAPGTPAPPPSTPSSPTPAPGSADDEPRPAELRAALRSLGEPSLTPSRLTFTQAVPAAGTVRWELLARRAGRLRALAERSRTLPAPRTVTARLRLDAAGRALLRRAPDAPVLLRTTLVTDGGREIVARVRVR
ncbi:MAG TPA: hypothetical protein VFR97_01235 [Capillimicrobium sp.]|nr:hypothetical protein [Capillimicrobium sp.]